MHNPLEKVARGLQGGCPGTGVVAEAVQSKCEDCGGVPGHSDGSPDRGWTGGNGGVHGAAGACLAAGEPLPAVEILLPC